MREYGKLATRFWTDPKVLGLSPVAKLAFTYLLAGPETAPAGCFRVTPMHLAASEVCGPDEAAEALEALAWVGLIKYDRAAAVVLIPNFLRYNPICNESAAKAAIKSLEQVPDSPLLVEAAEILKSLCDKIPAPWKERLGHLCRHKCPHECGDECQDECGHRSGHPLTRARAPIPIPIPIPIPNTIKKRSLLEQREEHQPRPADRPDPERALETGGPGDGTLQEPTVVPMEPEVFSADEGPATRCARLLAQLIATNDPAAPMPTTLDLWAVEMQRLHDHGKRTWEEIGEVIEWCQGHRFWMPKVLSARDLAKHFTRMRNDMLAERQPARPGRESVHEHNARVMRELEEQDSAGVWP